MSGKRLLDALSFLNATRTVAGKHVALRRRQVDVHLRTSSLTKEAKIQADRIALAAKAASELARKFDEPVQSASGSSAEYAGKGPEKTAKDGVPSSATGTTVNGKNGPINQTIKEDEIRVAGDAEESGGQTTQPTKGTETDVFEKVSQPRDSETVSQNQDLSGKATTRSNEGELPEAMMGELFRSRKVATNLGYRAKMSGTGRPAAELPGRGGGIDMRSPPNIVASELAMEPSTLPESKEDTAQLGSELASDISSSTGQAAVADKPVTPYKMIESRVPSSRLGRLWEYGGLATSMAFGVVGETLRRATASGDSKNGSLVFSPLNMERLVAKLSKMRGAALKLGQMMSFQDSKMLPPAIQEVLQRVQDQANYMPASQRDKVLADNLGPNWRDLFESFDEVPMAAASIGQVHNAVLKETGQRVAVKVQYPGVANSIDSDLNNLSILLTASRLLPKGLFLDKTIANARTELAWECDYVREADCGKRFRQLLQDETSVFVVPEIIDAASGKQVLTMERMDGIAVTKIQTFNQAQRDWIGTQILRLCLREICEFRFMQTDPNWTNFLYNSNTNRLELLDFGASREYPASFIATYLRTLLAASRNDREACRDLSIKLGYLTGYETPAMIDAHISSILTIAEPFMSSAPDVYDFSDQTITDRVRGLIPLMLRERLSPPPEETYSLHRKLSGAFLLCARLGSRVRCKELFNNALEKVEWVDEEPVLDTEGAKGASSTMV